MTPPSSFPSPPPVVRRLASVATPLAAAAALLGLTWPAVYGDAPAEVQALARGADLITVLVAVPMLWFTERDAVRGRVEAHLLFLALLAFLAGTYGIYAIAVPLGSAFLLHAALAAVTGWAAILGYAALPVDSLPAAFGPSTPIRRTSVLLGLIGTVFAAGALHVATAPLWGHEPRLFELPTATSQAVVFVVLIGGAPAALLAGVRLSQRRAWGYGLAPAPLLGLAGGLLWLVAGDIVLAFSGAPPHPAPTAVGVAGFGLVAFSLWSFLAGAEDAPDLHGSSGAGPASGG